MAAAQSDPYAILAALGITTDIAAVKPVSGGSDTLLWRVEWAGKSYALRVFRQGQERVATREALVMRAGLPVPIPAVRAFGQWQDRPAMLIDWCRGTHLLDAFKADPGAFWTLARLFGATHARLHAATPPPALVGLNRSWIDWAAGGSGGLADYLQTLPAVTPSVLHFDYHPLNVMVAARQVTGIIDWANVHIGDRRADLARTVAILRLAPLGRGVTGTAMRLATRLLEIGWRRGYRASAGPMTGMAPFYAWAGTALINDLTPKVGQPGTLLQSADLTLAHRWTAYWRQQVGVPTSW